LARNASLANAQRGAATYPWEVFDGLSSFRQQIERCGCVYRRRLCRPYRARRVLVFCCHAFSLTRTGTHPRIKSGGMFCSKTLWRSGNHNRIVCTPGGLDHSRDLFFAADRAVRGRDIAPSGIRAFRSGDAADRKIPAHQAGIIHNSAKRRCESAGRRRQAKTNRRHARMNRAPSARRDNETASWQDRWQHQTTGTRPLNVI
jgi:hypothetical protein